MQLSGKSEWNSLVPVSAVTTTSVWVTPLCSRKPLSYCTRSRCQSQLWPWCQCEWYPLCRNYETDFPVKCPRNASFAIRMLYLKFSDREYYEKLSLDSKRALYTCGSKYLTLDKIQTWEEFQERSEWGIILLLPWYCEHCVHNTYPTVSPLHILVGREIETNLRGCFQ